MAEWLHIIPTSWIEVLGLPPLLTQHHPPTLWFRFCCIKYKYINKWWSSSCNNRTNHHPTHPEIPPIPSFNFPSGIRWLGLVYTNPGWACSLKMHYLNSQGRYPLTPSAQGYPGAWKITHGQPNLQRDGNLCQQFCLSEYVSMYIYI